MTAGKRAVLLVGLCVGAAVTAADPPAGSLKNQQAQNAEQFRLIKDQLLKLSQKLAASDKPAERDRAKVIQAALDVAYRENVEGQFRALAGELAKDAATVGDLERAISQDGQLQKALQDMFALLLTDDEAVRQKAEIQRLTEALKEARDILRAQETLRTMTDVQKADAAKLAKSQADLADRTKALDDRMAGDKTGKKGVDPKAKSPGEPKGGKDSQPGDPKGGEPKKGDAGKPGEPKPGDQKPGQDGKPAEPKAGEGKQSDGAKPGEPKDGKPTDGKPGETKPKGGDPSQAGDPQPAPPPRESKPGNKSPDAKSPPDSPPAGDSPPPDGSKPPLPGRQRIQEAVPQQKGAADDLDKQKRPDAGRKQDKAIDDISKAVKELERRLRQLREEEAMRQLAGLEARCNRMIQLQQAVYDATKAIDAGVQKAGGKKENADRQKAQAQGDKEREIVGEADKTLDLLKAEGSAVAFAGVLQEVRADMLSVQRRLEAAEVGPETQAVEASILALLKEMAAALKKQQQEMKQQHQQAQQQPSSGPPPNQELANKIAQIKLIRSLQQEVNTRTKLLGGKAPGEQAGDPQVTADLRALAARQVRIQEMLEALATGANQ